MRDDLPTGTVTFLFTDVEGSTKLLQSLGTEAYADALAEHRRVIRETCSAQSGVEVDTQGDAFFFAFPTAPVLSPPRKRSRSCWRPARSMCASACTPGRRSSPARAT
jgi:class 3 adenylate cyclase